MIAVGFLMADAVDTVAKQFPDVDFAIVDVDQERAEVEAAERRAACSSRRRRPATSSATSPGS